MPSSRVYSCECATRSAAARWSQAPMTSHPAAARAAGCFAEAHHAPTASALPSGQRRLARLARRRAHTHAHLHTRTRTRDVTRLAARPTNQTRPIPDLRGAQRLRLDVVRAEDDSTVIERPRFFPRCSVRHGKTGERRRFTRRDDTTDTRLDGLCPSDGDR